MVKSDSAQSVSRVDASMFCLVLSSHSFGLISEKLRGFLEFLKGNK